MKSSRAFDFNEYARIAARNDWAFDDLGTVVTQGNGEGNTYTFKDNGSSVLGVAHVDTVQLSTECSLIRVNGEKVLLSPRLDDRLGVYIITKLLPRLGITCDWLLTTGEETGNSSAELFLTEKDYNWAFSFDRSGRDVVLYQYEHKALRRVMRKAGFQVGNGSFSDLSSLDIGCSGVNFGCGYYDNHSIHAYAILGHTFQMVDLFQLFWRKWATQKLPYDPSSRHYTMTSWERGRDRAYAHRNWGRVHGYSDWGYTGYSGGYPEGKIADGGQGISDGEYIWVDGQKLTHGEYLDWYGKNYDLPEDGLTQEERLEILADQANEAEGKDDGR